MKLPFTLLGSAWHFKPLDHKNSQNWNCLCLSENYNTSKILKAHCTESNSHKMFTSLTISTHPTKLVVGFAIGVCLESCDFVV